MTMESLYPRRLQKVNFLTLITDNLQVPLASPPLAEASPAQDRILRPSVKMSPVARSSTTLTAVSSHACCSRDTMTNYETRLLHRQWQWYSSVLDFQFSPKCLRIILASFLVQKSWVGKILVIRWKPAFVFNKLRRYLVVRGSWFGFRLGGIW